MAETFLTVVNEVLDALGEPRLTTINFATATQKQRKVKTIAAREYKRSQTSMPDEHLHATQEIRIYAPKDFPGGDGIGIEAISAANPGVATIGGTADITVAPDGYLALGLTVNSQNQNVVAYFQTASDDGIFDHDQWYRIRQVGSTSISLDVPHLVAEVNTSGITGKTSPNRMPFTLAQFRVPLPADFMDPVDVSRPFSNGVDMTPVGPNELTKLVRDGSTAIADNEGFHPRFYSIGYDMSLQLANTRLGPFLSFYPFPTENRLYQLRYKRRLLAVTEDSAFNTVFDLPEEMVNSLIYRVLTRAKLEIARQPEEAGIYRGLERDHQKELKEREISQTANSTIAPDVSTRAFYRNRRVGPRIWVNE